MQEKIVKYSPIKDSSYKPLPDKLKSAKYGLYNLQLQTISVFNTTLLDIFAEMKKINIR